MYIQWWPKSIKKLFYPFWPPLYMYIEHKKEANDITASEKKKTLARVVGKFEKIAFFAILGE